jgi:acyl-CoA synthetase (AMP-forming)/AMP-acid ligase II
MTVRVLGDAVTRDRRSDVPALRAGTREYDYRRFCTTAWKTGNLLRNEGVRSGTSVAVADDPAPEAVLSFYGAALLGGVVGFGPDALGDRTKALVVPTTDLDGYDAGPRTRRVGYGSQPEDPSVAYFERDVWSENPTEPPDQVEPDDPLLRTPDRTWSHGEVLDAARTVADDWGLEPGDAVAVRAPFAHPGAVAAGLVAPILGGAVVLLPDGDEAGDYAVGSGGPEPSVDPDTVLR